MSRPSGPVLDVAPTGAPTTRRGVLRALARRLLVTLLLPVLSAFAPSTLSAQVDLVLNVTDAPDPVPRTGVVTYSVIIENNGLTTATGVSYQMQVPAGTRYDGFTAGTGASCSGLTIGQAGPGVLTCTHPSLAFAASGAFTVRLRLDQQGSTDVTSTVTSTQPDADPPNNTVVSQTTVVAGADVAMQLSATSATVASGSTVGFTLGINNLGPDAASALRVQFPVPSGFIVLGALPAGCVNGGGTITCDVSGPIASGASASIGTITGRVVTAAGSTITGSASVAVQPGAPALTPQDPNTLNNGATFNVAVTAGSDVRVTIARSVAGPYFVGNGFNFVLSAAYDGDVPNALTMSTTLPNNYTVGAVASPQAGWTCSVSAQQVTCTRPAGGVAGANQSLGSVSIPVTIASAGAGVVTTATISAGSPFDPDLSNNTVNDGGATLLDPTADLVISKTGPNPALGVVGVPFNWTLRATNAGPSVFHGTMVITDNLPTGVTVTNVTLNGWTCSPALPVSGPDPLTCQRVYTAGAPLASGATTPSIVLTVEATVDGALQNSATLTTINPNVADPNLGNNTTTSTVTTSPGPSSADLSVLKSVNLATVPAGEVLTYQLEVVNGGPVTATSLTLRDTLLTLINNAAGPTGAGYVGQTVTRQGVASAVTCSSATQGATGRVLTCTIPSLPVCTAGVDCPVVEVSIRPGGNGGARVNRAHIISNDVADPALANNVAEVSSTVEARADVRITKTDTPDPATAGQNLTYVLAAINDGPSQAANVVVLDSLPLGVLFVSASGAAPVTCPVTPTPNTVTTAGNRVVECAMGAINSGAQRTVTVIVRPGSAQRGTSIENIGRVSTTTVEPTTPGDTNNRVTATTAINNPTLDLLVNKTDSVDPLSVGSNTVYTITVTNNGPSDAENVLVTDQLPAAGLSYQSHTISAGVCGTVPAVGAVGGTLACTVSRIAAGSTTTITVTMLGITKGIYTNAVSVQSDETVAGFDVNGLNNSATQATTVRTRADVEVVSKIASPTPIAVRRPFAWTIRVRNNTGVGLAEADTVRVSDNLPTNMELTGTPTVAVVSGTISENSCTGVAGGTSFTCDLGTLSSGGEVDITVPVRHLVVPAGGTVTNTATVTTTSLDVTPGNNTRDGTVTVTGASLAGFVFRDFNDNGDRDPVDTGIGSITVTITGTAFDGSAVSRTTNTAADGTFSVTGLPEGTYAIQRGTVSEAFLVVGQQRAGTSGGVASTPPNITGVTLAENATATDYRFAFVPQARLGMAKRVVGTPVANSDGSITAVLRILARNYSLEPLETIQITDPLAGAAPRFGTLVPGGAAAALSAGTYTIQVAPTIVGACATASTNAAFNGDGTTLLATIGSLAASAQCEFDITLRYQPTNPLPVGNYTNQATGTVTGGAFSGQAPSDQSQNGPNPDPDGDGNPGNNNVPTPLNAVLAADVTTAVSFASPVDAGQVVSGTVLYRNLGPYAGENVSYTLTLATGLAGVTFGNLPAGATATYNSGTGAVTFAGMPTSLTPNQIASGDGSTPITVSYVQNGVANSTVTSGIATTSNEGQNVGPNSAIATIIGQLIADVTTSLAFPATADAGTAVTGTVVFRNTGPSTASGMTYTLTLSSGLTGVSFSNLPVGATATYNAGTGVVTFVGMPATLPINAIASGTGTSGIVVNYTQPGTATSTVTSAIGTTTNQGANVQPDTATTTLTGQLIADVTTSLAFPVSVDAGQIVSGTIRFENTGPSTASGMTYALTLTPGLTGVTFGNLPAGATATYDSGSGAVTFTGMPGTLAINALASGDGTTGITLSYVQPGAAISTIASTIGTSTNQGANVALDNAVASPGGGFIADVRALVTAPALVNAGGTVATTVTFSNLGPSTAAGVGYTLTLTPGLTGVTFGNLPAGATATYNAGTGVVTFTGMPNTLASGAIASGNGTSGITLQYTQNGVANSTVTATISTTTNQGANIAPDSDTKTVLGDQIADVTTSLEGFTGPVPPGAPVTGIIRFRNAGPSTSTGTTYALTLTPGLTGVVFGNLPAGVTASYNAGTGAVTFTGMPSTVTSGTIVSGDGVNGISLTYAQLGASTTIRSQIGTATNQGANALPDIAEVEVLGRVEANLSVRKTTDASAVTPGDTVTFRLVITNLGPTALPVGSVLTDEPSSGVQLLAVRCALVPDRLCATPPSPDALRAGATLPAMAVGATFVLDVDALITATFGSEVRNTARVSTPPGYVDEDLTDNTSSTPLLPVQGAPDLALVKRANGAVVPGAMAQYTMRIENRGTGPTTDLITVTDSLPASLTFVRSAGPEWQCVTSGATVVCVTDRRIAAGGALDLRLDLQVDPAATGSIRNLAFVGVPRDRQPVNDTSVVQTPLSAGINLAMRKQFEGDSLRAGATARYTLRVRNVGSAITTAPIVVVDSLPSGLTPLSASGDGFVCTVTNAAVRCERTAPLPVDAEVALTVQVQVASDVNSPLSNRACVSTSGDVAPADDCATVTTPVASLPRVRVVKSAPTTAAAGTELVYRLVTYNDGAVPAPGPFRIVDTLPAGISVREVQSTGMACRVENGVVECSTANVLPARDSLVVTIATDIAATASGAITNCATLDAPNARVATADRRSCHTVTVSGVGALRLRKTATADTLRLGAPASWRVIITNSGTAPSARPVRVVDSLPLSVQPNSAAGDGFTCQVNGQVISCERAAAIAAGDSVVLLVNGTVRADATPGSVRNVACLTGNDTACADAETPLTGTPTVQLLKQAIGDFVVGETGTFRIVARNTGSAPLAAPFTIIDSLPRGVQFATAAGNAAVCTHTNGVVRCERTTPLAVGDSAVITITAQIAAAAAPAFTNCAVLAASTSQAPRACVTVRPTTDYRITLELSTPRYVRELRDAPDFTVLVRNVGRSPLPDVVITNRLPAGFTYVAGSSTRGGRPDLGARGAIADPSGGAGPVIGWPIGTLAPGQVVRIDYRALIRAGASFNADNITISVATSSAPGLQVTSNTASVPIRLERGVFDTRGIIAGKLYVQCDCDSVRGQQDGEVGIPGVRLLLEDGTAAITDVEGKYNFLDVRAGLHVVKVDASTLPAGARLVTTGTRNAGDGDSRFVDLKVGELHRADFVEGSGSAEVLSAVLARRRTGEVNQAVLTESLAMTPRPQSTPYEPLGSTRSAGRGAFDLRPQASTVSPTPDSIARLAAQNEVPGASGPSLTHQPTPRPLVAAGLLQGRVDLRELSRGTVRLGGLDDGFEDALRDMATDRDSGRVRAAARGALLLAGDLGTRHRLTLAFDSERDPMRTQFRDITPESGFSVFGDASLRVFDAQSQERLYVRLDRGNSFVRYGDFATPRSDERRLLLAYDRSLTGLSAHAEGRRGVLNVFAANNALRQQVDELPGRGLSGPYYLSRPAALINSERVELVTRDRNQPAIILRSEPMRRFEQYVVEPGTGRLLFRAPVPSLDANLNPIFIRVSYEVEQTTGSFLTWGGEGTARLGSRLEVGGFAVRDENPLDAQTLLGASASAAFGSGTLLMAELARSVTGVDDVAGTAWRVELRHTSERLDGRVFAVQGDSTFGNRSSTFLGGRTEVGVRGRATLNARTRLLGEALHTEDDRTTGRRDGVLLSLERQLTRTFAAEVGYRWADENGAPVSTFFTGGLGTGSSDAPTSISNSLTPLSFQAARIRLSGRLPQDDRSLLFAEYEHGLDASGARRGAIGGEYRLFDRARVYLRHEWLSSTQGPFALAQGTDQQNTVFGIDADYLRNGQLFSEYRARDAFNGRDAEASIGLRNRWPIAEGIVANTSFERVTPLVGAVDGTAFAITSALEFTRSPLWKGTARVEWRTSPAGDNLLGSLGYARKLSRDWSLLGRSLWDQVVNGDLRGRSQLGLAWRQTDRNRVNALFRVENRLDQADALGAPTDRSIANVFAALLNVQPASELTLSLRYAGKSATDRREGVRVNAVSHLLMARSIVEVTSRFDLGLIGSVTGDGDLSERRYGLGSELGVVVRRNLRLAGGYNLFGFTDRDFQSLGYTQRGPYVEFGLKFDESLFGKGRNTP